MPSPRIAERWIVAALAGVCAASAAATLAPFGWPFELFAHFRPQLACSAALLVPALLATRSPRAALIAGALAAMLLAPGARRLRADEPAAACMGESFVAVTANVQYSNRDPQRLLDWLAAHPADVVVLQEVTPPWAARLSGLERYPYASVVPRVDPYGIALLSRWPLDSVAPVDLAGDGLPSLEAVVAFRGQPLHVLGLHARWPITPELARLRNRALERVAGRVRAQALPTLAVGDLNLAPDSPVFHQLLDDSGLRDVFAGRGWHPTWMAGFWPLALRIDHQLASPALCVEQAEVGPDIGSDHRPVIARYRMPPAPPPRA